MPLRITLKSGERLFIGGAVVSNDGHTCHLVVHNKVPILRQKEILTEAKAITPCMQIYLVIQLMYMDEKNVSKYHKIYWQLVREVVQAAPSTMALIDRASMAILAGQYYQALKQARKLIRYEKELIQHVDEPHQSVRAR